MQLFMPRVEVVTEGDHLHELYIVLAGLVETFKPGISEHVEDISLNIDPDASYHSSMSRYNPEFCNLLFLSLLMFPSEYFQTGEEIPGTAEQMLCKSIVVSHGACTWHTPCDSALILQIRILLCCVCVY